MAAEEFGPLLQRIITHRTLGDNVNEIKFPSPVCLTGITLGAVPGAFSQPPRPFVNVFALDARAQGAARFACLYEGLQQPVTGESRANLQPFITEHVVLRGRYQTAPITLHGFYLDQAAATRVAGPPPLPLSLETALPRFAHILYELPHPPQTCDLMQWDPDAAALLNPLLDVWRTTKAVPRKIAAAHLPSDALRAVMATADSICERLAEGACIPGNSRGMARKSVEPTPEEDEFIDMVMGWIGLLADTVAPGTATSTQIFEVAVSGLAAAVIVCVRPAAAASFLARHGQLLLAEATTAPGAPGSQIRHAAAVGLLLVQNCGAVACEALLGWWRPSFVQWVAVPSLQRTKKETHEPKLAKKSDIADSKTQQSRKKKGDGKDDKSSRHRAVTIPQVDGAADHHDGDRRRPEMKDRSSKRTKTGRTNGASIAGDRLAGRLGTALPPVDEDDRWDGGGIRTAKDVEIEFEESRRSKYAAEGRSRDSHKRRSRSPAAEARGLVRGKEGQRSPKERKSRGDQEQSKRDVLQEKVRDDKRKEEKKHQVKEGKKREAPSSPRKRRMSASPPKRARHATPTGPSKPDTNRRSDNTERLQHEEWEDTQQLRMATKFWDTKLRAYSGLYEILAAALVELRPRVTAQVCTRLLNLLRFYERAATFDITAGDLVRRYEDQPSKSLPPREAANVAARCAAALAGLAEGLASCGQLKHGVEVKRFKANVSTGSFSNPLSEASWNVDSEPNTLLLELLEARGVLSLLPPLLLVPAVHKARLSEAGDPIAAASGAAMLNQIALGVKPFVSVITSSVAGIKVLAAREGALLGGLFEALSNTAVSGCNPGLQALAKALESLVVGAVAVTDLSQSLESQEFEIAAETLRNLISSGSPSKRIPSLFAVALLAKTALPACVRAAATRCALLRHIHPTMHSLDNDHMGQEDTAASPGTLGVIHMPANPEAFIALVESSRPMDIGLEILSELVMEPHESVLGRVRKHFPLADVEGPSSQSVLAQLAIQTEALLGSGVPGARAIYATACHVLGGFDAVHLCQRAASYSSALVALAGALNSDLPDKSSGVAALTIPGSIEHRTDDQDMQSSSVKDVEAASSWEEYSQVPWTEVRDFWDDPRRRGRAETSLRLVTAMLWGKEGSATAAALYNADGLRVAIRAVATGSAALEAALADRQWIRRAGAAMDTAACAANHLAALQFLGAAAAMASAMLQHVRGAVRVGSKACVTALVRAHGMVCADEGVLLTMLGKHEEESRRGEEEGGGAVAVAVRGHLAAALRCWFDAPEWTPDIMDLILFLENFELPARKGTPGNAPSMDHGAGSTQVRSNTHAKLAFPPRRLFAAACLLGDLLTEEWPLAGRRPLQGPPSERRYRVAVAEAIQRSHISFSSLMTTCLTSESTLLRAATTRMLARASGLGGGMGLFLARPIVDGLDALCRSPSAPMAGPSQAPAHDARKILEVLVPLVYRPAMKAALLDLGAAATLANLMRFLSSVGGVESGSVDPAEVSAVCTMAIECLVVLCNPEIRMNFMVPAEQTALEEVPSVIDGTVVATFFLENLHSLGPNAALGGRVMRLLAGSPLGRAALRRAATALHAIGAGGQVPPEPSPAQVIAAAQWVANRYWSLAQQAQRASATMLADTFAEVTDIMKEACAALDADATITFTVPPPAPERFIAVINQSKESESKTRRSQDLELRWVGAAGSHGDLVASDFIAVWDPISQMFWKNAKERAVQQTAELEGAILKQYTRRECLPDDTVTVNSTLHPPLSHPIRPMEENMHEVEDTDEMAREQAFLGGPDLQLETKVQGEEEGSALAAVNVAPFERPTPQLTSPEIKPEARMEAQVPTIPSVPSPVALPGPLYVAPGPAEFDLYADLDVGGDGLSVPSGSTPADVKALEDDLIKKESENWPMEKETPTTLEEQPSVGEHVAGAEIESRDFQDVKNPVPLGDATISGPAAKEVGIVPGEPRGQPATGGPSSELSKLLSDPSALTALLQDPVRLQALLEDNPALLEVLKQRLGS